VRNGRLLCIAGILEEDGSIREILIEPSELGLRPAGLEDIKGGDVERNRQIAERVLEGEEGPCRDVVVLNAAAALFVAGRVPSIKEGIEAAREAIDSGRAREALEKLREVSREYDSPRNN